MALLLILQCLFLPKAITAQYTSARIGVNGLTCSACTRSVEMSIRKLPFIENVEMNLENTDGILKFKKGQEVDIFKIAQAVVDAGFSVRFLNADYTFSNTNITDRKYNENGYSFYLVRKTPLKKENTLRFIGRPFKLKKNSQNIKLNFQILTSKIKLFLLLYWWNSLFCHFYRTRFKIKAQ